MEPVIKSKGEFDYHIRGRDVSQPCIKLLSDSLRGGKTVYIVGKGPSIDDLAADDFKRHPLAPVLCINESVHTIEKLNIRNPLYCVQYDKLDGKSNKPRRATWFLSTNAWMAQNGGASKAVQFDLKKIYPDKPNLTASTAISMAGMAGANKAIMLGFDAAISGDCNYASSIGHSHIKENHSDDRFIKFSKRGIPTRAKKEGVQLVWQAPKNFWFIALVLRSGGIYHMGHVDAIAEQIDKHLKTPHKILLFTDFLDTGNYTTVKLGKDWPGWFSKLELFRNDVCYHGGVLYTDLDNYFGRDFELPRWDTLKDGIYMLKDSNLDMYNSALMAFRLNEAPEPFDVFNDRPITVKTQKSYSDQIVINYALHGRIKLIDELVSNGSFKKDKPAKDGVDCVFFYGKLKPWDAGWVEIPEKQNAL